jgi:hypothetical protein
MKKSQARAASSADDRVSDPRSGSIEGSERPVGGIEQGDDARFDRLFRPTSLDEYV